MPVEKYFSGHGASVLESMKKKHGDEAGEREFYATANAHPEFKPGGGSGMKPKRKKKRMLIGEKEY